MNGDKVNLREKFSLFNDQWKPKIVGELNGQHVKLVKFQGRMALPTCLLNTTSCASSLVHAQGLVIERARGSAIRSSAFRVAPPR
jgi:hypothetical protein